MRKRDPDSAVAQFPYALEDGVYHYDNDVMEEMEGMMVEELSKYISKDRIFLWKEQ